MTRKPDRPELPKPKGPVEALRWVGEPGRFCGNCEHFDGGGLGKDARPINQEGDCHNGISGMFTTKAGNTACARGFYPCTTRWPLPGRLGIVPGA